MLNRLLAWTDSKHNRLVVLMSILVLVSWPILAAQIQMGQVLISIQTVTEVTNLSQIKDTIFLTRVIAGILDKIPLGTLILTSGSWQEVLFLFTIILLSFKNDESPWLYKPVRAIFLIQFGLNYLLAFNLYRAVTTYSPQTALDLLHQTGQLHIWLCLGLLIAGFGTWLKLLFEKE